MPTRPYYYNVVLVIGRHRGQIREALVREHFVADWAFGITGAIENSVRRNFPQELRRWPLLQSFNAEAYGLPDEYAVFVLKDKLSGIPSVGSDKPKPFPFSDYPALPPKSDDIELWQFYLREKFDLRDEDAAFLIPIKDSGKNDASADYDLFSPEEQMFWSNQLGYVVARYKLHLQSVEGAEPQRPTNVTYNVGGTNTRVNINSTDSSVNVVRTDASEVFDQLRGVLFNIEDEEEREAISASIDGMESAHNSPNFLDKYKEFMAVAADHATLFAPFFPALAGLLG